MSMVQTVIPQVDGESCLPKSSFSTPFLSSGSPDSHSHIPQPRGQLQTHSILRRDATQVVEINGNTKLVAENFGVLSEGGGLSPSPAEAPTAALTPHSHHISGSTSLLQH